MAARSGLRKIRNGRVKFGGRWYRPSDCPSNGRQYDGTLDGQKWLFISYQPSRDMLAMWGDELAFHDANQALREDQPNIDADGSINWYFWKPE